MKSQKNKYTAIDLFCGAGGLSKGFEQAGYNILLGIDSVEQFIKTFAHNHKRAKIICDDIRNVTIKEIIKKTDNKKIDIIIGGPPCQGFSMAGRRDPKDPRNSLFMEYVRIVKGIKPKYFVLENVKGLLSMKTLKGEQVINIIENEFKKIGYRVNKKVLIAADYGVPQKRQRVIVIGTRTSNPITFPKPTHTKLPSSDLFALQQKWVGVETILFNKKDVPSEFFHSQKMIDGFRKRRIANVAKGHGFGWQVLRKGEPSYTISARYYKDGADALVQYSENEIRMLTPRECARIQTFPDDFEFLGSKKIQYTQIGNAVPVLLAKVIGLEIKRYLNKEVNKSDKSEKKR